MEGVFGPQGGEGKQCSADPEAVCAVCCVVRDLASV